MAWVRYKIVKSEWQSNVEYIIWGSVIDNFRVIDISWEDSRQSLGILGIFKKWKCG